MLSAVGLLDPEQEQVLKAMEPKLREVYGVEGGWLDVVAAQMQFPDSLPLRIKAIWEAGVESAGRQGLSVNANDFAVAFVDANFQPRS
ncbi:hypothetical protein [Stenotrophomonas sp. PS02289]|uniref:hypothetical protein n=1 Tax=Stenotrophomonas sp. PS02289 TaxID=2991422 RepID=UPI00249B703E|nr:hypothetical protein [Stenotrophomonas sp. PS02289]